MLIVPQATIDISSTNVPNYDTALDIYVVEDSKVYNTEDETQYGDTIWKCLKNDTVDVTPGTDSLVWSAQSKTNKYRCFDAFMSSSTKNNNSIYYKFNIGDVDTVALFGLNAQSVRVVIKDADGNTQYDETVQTLSRYVTNWYDWTYTKAKEKKSIHFRNLPMIYNATMEITIDNTGTTAECSHMVFGTSMDIGITLLNPSPIVSVRNIIPKTKDSKGVVTTTNSMTYKRVVANVLVENDLIDDIQIQLDILNAQACLFLADEREEGFSSLSIFGLFKDFDIPIGYQKSVYQIEIEGVV